MAKFMSKFKRKGFWAKVGSIVLAVVLLGGAIAGISAVVKYAKDDQETIHPTFSVGGLDDSGVYTESKETIYTKNSFEAKGLEVKIDFDSTVKYQVFFYDEMDKYLSSTEVYTSSEDISVPIGARARIEVTPIWGEDAPLEKEIKWYETAKYSSQLEIRVDKRQELLESDFVSYSLGNTDMFERHANQLVGWNYATQQAEFETPEDESQASRAVTYEYVAESSTAMYIVFDQEKIKDYGEDAFFLKVVTGDHTSLECIDNAFHMEVSDAVYLNAGDEVYFQFLLASTDEDVGAVVKIYFA